jgi:hypothetical protein
MARPGRPRKFRRGARHTKSSRLHLADVLSEDLDSEEGANTRQCSKCQRQFTNSGYSNHARFCTALGNDVIPVNDTTSPFVQSQNHFCDNSFFSDHQLSNNESSHNGGFLSDSSGNLSSNSSTSNSGSSYADAFQVPVAPHDYNYYPDTTDGDDQSNSSSEENIDGHMQTNNIPMPPQLLPDVLAHDPLTMNGASSDFDNQIDGNSIDNPALGGNSW